MDAVVKHLEQHPEHARNLATVRNEGLLKSLAEDAALAEPISMGEGQGQELAPRQAVIPGGTCFSKRAEMFLPEHWPAYYSRVKGCRLGS